MDKRILKEEHKRWLYWLWLVWIAGFALLHALHLRADFPNHSPWFSDWAKYTDEGWYGAAALRARVLGHWFLPGDLNTAVALPVLPVLEWLVFCVTGASVVAARGLAVGFFFLNLVLSYLLLRRRTPKWAALLAVTLLATSPFYYCFSRLAILEQPLTALLLLALNMAVRLKEWRHSVLVAAGVGLVFGLMMLTKSTAVFLLPALLWALVVDLWGEPKLMLRAGAAMGGVAAAVYGGWMALIAHAGLMPDYHYLLFINKYPKPHEFYWPLVSLKWSVHGGLWIGHVLFPLTVVVVIGAVVAYRHEWGWGLLTDPAFGASVLAAVGYIGFMTYQNHPQPRYFAVVAMFSFLIVAQGAAALLHDCYGVGGERRKRLGVALIAVVVCTMASGSYWVIQFAFHPQYSFVHASKELTHYIDTHPNGNRLLLSISADEIMLATHMPGICDDFGTQDLPKKLVTYKPGWYAAWNDLDPGTLEDIHLHYSLEQVAEYPAFDDPERNVLVLFKLHPLPPGQERDYGDGDLRDPLPDDKIRIPIE
ncbi:MAG: glycosyltransferase family 39 protein [Terracidiphilus sp.]|nr:glycosyltransferase family 39 protein [Terracidiphilus sp.]